MDRRINPLRDWNDSPTKAPSLWTNIDFELIFMERVHRNRSKFLPDDLLYSSLVYLLL